MPHPDHVLLDISNADSSLEFYVDRLGMKLDATDTSTEAGATIYSLSFKTGASLQLRQRTDSKFEDARYEPRDTDAYWKIGITVSDVDLARERLLGHGIEATEAAQFHDIGYLCHLDDPDGYCIELLQHTFQSNHKPQAPLDSEPLGTPPNLGQISLNVSNIEKSLAFYRDRIGMKVLSRQTVPDRGFTLWFLGHPDLTLPATSIAAVENREWLWQLPETTLELRAFDQPIQSRRAHPSPAELGFRGIGISGLDGCDGQMEDPDGVLVSLSGD